MLCSEAEPMQYIYDLIKREEEQFRQPIPLQDNWEWSMKDHILMTVSYKNSVFKDGIDLNKPFKNIIRPILNLQHRAEGFDVKDILLLINDQYKYFKSFLVRKFHEKWARENGLDTFIDEMVESFVDFGAALIKKSKKPIPGVVPLQRIAFCDQSDMLGGPMCEVHFYSPEELREEAKQNGWEDVDMAISKSQEEREAKGSGARKAKTPGKHIKVYELHGLFPRKCLYKTDVEGNYFGEYYDEDAPENDLVRQMHICVLYETEGGKYGGISLYKGKESTSPYKRILRDEIYGRALGLGGGEELFQSQIWTNYGMIRLKELLDTASKTLFKTTDESFANRNKTENLENGEILVLADGKDIGQVDNTPRSTQLFDKYVADWELSARQIGAANESILGESPTSGTPFKLQELVTAESHSLHEYRKGKLAIFLDEIYQDWILPRIAKEISSGQEFLAELDLEELEQVSEGLVICETNKMVKEHILNGEELTPELIEQHKAMVKEEFRRGGTKRFLKILEGELKDVPMTIEVNIAGKQKDLARKTDKLVNIFRQIIAAPQVLDDPRMAKIFNQILESSGLSPIDFYRKPQPPVPETPPVVKSTPNQPIPLPA